MHVGDVEHRTRVPFVDLIAHRRAPSRILPNRRKDGRGTASKARPGPQKAQNAQNAQNTSSYRALQADPIGFVAAREARRNTLVTAISRAKRNEFGVPDGIQTCAFLCLLRPWD